jgi:cation diffusion facilitator CzcD-associated flavoprotein CzcO
MFDVGIIGGGIVGLATAYQLGQKFRNCRLRLLRRNHLWPSIRPDTIPGFYIQVSITNPVLSKRLIVETASKRWNNFARNRASIMNYAEKSSSPSMMRKFHACRIFFNAVRKMG